MLYDIKMNASRSFKDVKSVFVATSGVADLVLNTQGQAELKQRLQGLSQKYGSRFEVDAGWD